MALLEHKTCLRCHESYFAGSSDDGVCPKCHRAEEEAKFEKHMEELRKLSLEERIERIEKILYERTKTKTYFPTKFDVFY